MTDYLIYNELNKRIIVILSISEGSYNKKLELKIDLDVIYV
jgi:hypothetical protein